jgi:hypothetical protein
MGNGTPHGPVPNVLIARVTGVIPNQVGSSRVGEGVTNEGGGVRDQIARTLREFGFAPKGRARAY